MNKTPNIFDSRYFLTDGGLETTLIFHNGIKLNHFAAFELLLQDSGIETLKNYYSPYLEIAAKHSKDFILETPTWRANPDWATKLGYSKNQLQSINMMAVEFIKKLAKEKQHLNQNIILSGNIGPRGDGYAPNQIMTSGQAYTYHKEQIETFAQSGVDMITALTINYIDEGVGIVQAAKEYDLPVVISFTVETDGNLPSGESLKKAIQLTDALTNNFPLHYMINCAHPEHFNGVLKNSDIWINRIRGIRANASTKSHEELDQASELDTGDMLHLAMNYAQLKSLLPELRVIGGCCGTDHNHIEQICKNMFATEVV